MKVDPTKSAGIARVRRADKSGKAGGTAFADILGSTEATDQTAGPSTTSGVDAVFAAQDVGDREGHARQARDRAEMMVARLEDIRNGLLMGSISESKLEQLATAARSQREAFDDPRLTEILDDIELRARVELAKLGRTV
ncbi:MAG: flagellar assembly protein FliX [Alphaproteobacteria bacterium]|nr:flagellar assembly protein FliX [Alphaproteobacteria bacterium]